ncbi:hypothetical protein GY45DRAFT_1376120 [Cubamyces sp. BRFM 1775]|nr:hypothetical protein GY45DRAFT_1376120 [Cubamyces sp. BRFM 1775]
MFLGLRGALVVVACHHRRSGTTSTIKLSLSLVVMVSDTLSDIRVSVNLVNPQNLISLEHSATTKVVLHFAAQVNALGIVVILHTRVGCETQTLDRARDTPTMPVFAHVGDSTSQRMHESELPKAFQAR